LCLKQKRRPQNGKRQGSGIINEKKAGLKQKAETTGVNKGNKINKTGVKKLVSLGKGMEKRHKVGRPCRRKKVKTNCDTSRVGGSEKEGVNLQKG